jgi:hypothetical protein
MEPQKMYVDYSWNMIAKMPSHISKDLHGICSSHEEKFLSKISHP